MFSLSMQKVGSIVQILVTKYSFSFMQMKNFSREFCSSIDLIMIGNIHDDLPIGTKKVAIDGLFESLG